jgi:hypothetical protein
MGRCVTGKGANKQLLNNAGTAQSTSNTLSTKAAHDYDFLDPVLKGDVTNPQGYTPQQLAYINTAAQQSTGGGTSAVTGEANLEAARTRNAGGFQGAIGTGSRNAMKENSENALKVQAMQADLQQTQRRDAMKALQDLYGTNNTDALGYLNSSNSALGAENQSHPVQQGIRTASDLISSLTGAAKAGKEIRG